MFGNASHTTYIHVVIFKLKQFKFHNLFHVTNVQNINIYTYERGILKINLNFESFFRAH